MDQNQIDPMMKQITENLKKRISELFSAQAVKQLAISEAVEDHSKNDSNAIDKEPLDCCSDAVDNIALASELVLRHVDNVPFMNPCTELRPDPAVLTWLHGLDLACSALTVQHNSAIGCKQSIVVIALTLSRGFARRAAAPLYKYSSECKIWKPGLCAS